MIKRSITDAATALGFGLCGFAQCGPLEDVRHRYEEFLLEKGYATMQYLKRNAPQRLDPGTLLPGAKTVICVTRDYFPPAVIPEEDNYVVSKYAYGPDYHKVMKRDVMELAGFIRTLSPGIQTRAFVDSGTVLEKAWAQQCGIGWQGKNTLVINRERGSFFFLGVILTSLEVDPDPPAAAHCGNCDRCIKACPAGALDRPYRLDIRRCISYRTIETESEVAMNGQDQLMDRIYGCDICQDVCPFNRQASSFSNPECFPNEELMKYRKKDWHELKEEDFTRIFAGTAVIRRGYANLMNNIRLNRLQKES